jgi:hypothetical protein
MAIKRLLDKPEGAERDFVGSEFVAPILGSNRVSVRIAGLVCQLEVTGERPGPFSGWGVLRALSTSQAAFVRAATQAERAAYLQLFPAVRLILAARDGPSWLAVPAHRGDGRFQIAGPVALALPEEGLELFETIIARFDGRLFWHERRDPARNPALAAYLREQLQEVDEKGLPPAAEALHKRGLTREEREAYGLVRAALAEALVDKVEQRLSAALAHAGATFRAYVERGEAYVVEYEVDGRRHVSTVRPDDLTVMTAGICLAGQDRRFDLQSLVGVLREAEQGRRLVWVGAEGLPEEQYWVVHPPGEE